ncbi:MAG: GntR family transcriptional regulator [Hespellia sp.]|nr:GntR family transcriptional regulator [Hespellia sp.]
MAKKKEYLHETIRNDILNKINNGTYKENDVIPKEIDLAEAYGVSRPTVRQAIKSLEYEGYLTRKKKGGTIVLPPKISQEFVYSIQDFNSEMEKSGRVARTVLISFSREQELDEKIENILKPIEEEHIYKMVRLRYADEVPNVFVVSYVKVDASVDFMGYDFSKESLYSVLSRLESPVVEAKRTIEVIKADVGMSTLLSIEQNDPLFYFKTIGYSWHNDPIEYSQSYYRGDTNSFVIHINNCE